MKISKCISLVFLFISIKIKAKNVITYAKDYNYSRK